MHDLCDFNPNDFTAAPLQTDGWIDFQQSPEAVFAVIADHTGMTKWVPLVDKVMVSHPDGVAAGESAVGTTRQVTFKGGLEIVETVVYWNAPNCYAYRAEGKLFPLKNYVGLFAIQPADAQSGRFIFREYFDEMNRVEQAILPHGVVALNKRALGNLAALIGGSEHDMAIVSRAQEEK